MVRLFQNLVGNAVKYRKPGQPSEVHISAEQKGAEWVISIRDNGIGFDPQYASIIFAPFKRLHTAEEYPERVSAWQFAAASCRPKGAVSGLNRSPAKGQPSISSACGRPASLEETPPPISWCGRSGGEFGE